MIRSVINLRYFDTVNTINHSTLYDIGVTEKYIDYFPFFRHVLVNSSSD